MIYNDGFDVDNNLRFIKCPKCGNEEYSVDAKFCKICGFPAYNECEGSPEYDSFGNVIDFSIHQNVGNARYCEYCGKSTTLLKEKLLKPYSEVQAIQNDEDPLDFEDSFPFN